MNRIQIVFTLLLYLSFSIFPIYAKESPQSEQVTFSNGKLILHGVLYKPKGAGPFPALLYNHGSSPGMLNSQASDLLGPLYASHGWVFFMPYRRGQGLSSSQGPYIMDEVEKARKIGGKKAMSATMVRLLTTDHLSDQLAALTWLKKASFVQANRIAVAGNSFGGIETVLGAANGAYCAAIDASGGAQTWKDLPEIQAIMIEAVRNSRVPIFFFQAENDYDLAPSHVLSLEMKKAGKQFQVKIYPPFGDTAKKGHSFAYLGNSIWANDVFTFLKKYCGK